MKNYIIAAFCFIVFLGTFFTLGYYFNTKEKIEKYDQLKKEADSLKAEIRRIESSKVQTITHSNYQDGYDEGYQDGQTDCEDADYYPEEQYDR